MTATRTHYCVGTSAIKPECSRYRNENERIIDYSRAAEQWKRRNNPRHSARSYQRKKTTLRSSIHAAVEDSATVRDFRSGDLSGTPFNKSDSKKMNAYGLMYTIMGLVAIISVSI